MKSLKVTVIRERAAIGGREANIPVADKRLETCSRRGKRACPAEDQLHRGLLTNREILR
jgi:hypothetical protein